MVNAKIATSAEQPINRHAGMASYQGSEAELVGLDANGDVVQADAAAAAGPVPAVGVLMSPVDDPAGHEHPVDLVIEANRTVAGRDRVTFIHYGIEIENEDADWSFTPGGKVYLNAGGGYTQVAPSGTGDLVQQVGVALDAERIMLNVDHTA